MLICRKPVTVGGGVYPCNHCLPCRLKRKSQWKTRLLLEASMHKDNCFLTLTYADECLPTLTGKGIGRNSATLEPKHLQDWLKRFRAAIHPLKIRYFAAGEYSPPPNNRPHYHLIIFGWRGCLRGQTSKFHIQTNGGCCSNCELVMRTWNKGFIFSGSVTPQSVEYVMDYTMKKMVGPMADLYNGRYPEFSRQSLKPGIGYTKVDDVAEGVRRMEKNGQFLSDVPGGLRFGKTIMPLNPLFKRKVRLSLGREPTAPKEAQLEHSERLLPLREVARLSETSLSQIVAASTEQQAINQKAKHEIFKTRKKLK